MFWDKKDYGLAGKLTADMLCVRSYRFLKVSCDRNMQPCQTRTGMLLTLESLESAWRAAWAPRLAARSHSNEAGHGSVIVGLLGSVHKKVTPMKTCAQVFYIKI